MDLEFPYFGFLLVIYRDLLEFRIQWGSFLHSVGLLISASIQWLLIQCSTWVVSYSVLLYFPRLSLWYSLGPPPRVRVQGILVRMIYQTDMDS